MRKTLIILTFSLMSICSYAQTVITPWTLNSTLPSEYSIGGYILGSENDAPYLWPLDAGVVIGYRAATSAGRHVQMIIRSSGFQIRGKDGENDAWASWRKVLIDDGAGNYTIASGNLMVNTSTPKAKLTVNGDLYLGKTETIGSWNYTHLRYMGHSLVVSSPEGSHAHNVLEIKPGGKDATVSHSDLWMWRSNGAEESQKARVIQISTNPATYTYFNGGNVGIGTTNPGAYKLAVNGAIKAKEVEVTLSGWSDFVFEPTYKLRSLSEVETFIKANGHLPEIPSAKEVENNGVNLGEMDAKLLMKIEELTLYILEQDKRIKALEAKIEANNE